ncbi:MAG: polymerase [Deltaproteobacteria bacterium]|nr:polymerase [Deltaproteobacteria bacterium]
MSDRTLIASATNLLARGFLVVPTDRRSRAGEPVNALFAVARAIERVLAFKLPARAVAVIDAGAPKPSWPALLQAQLPALASLLETLGLHVVHAQDEAHVVASYARAALDDGHDVIVVGTDKRYAQLVSDRLWWYDANKDARYTPEIVQKRFGVPPAQVAEWLALVGDEDTLPGVKGIGAKGATTLIETYGSIERALANPDTVAGRSANAFRASLDAVRHELVRARLDDRRTLPVELDALAFTPPPPSSVNALYERLGFVELLAPEGSPMRVEVCDTRGKLEAALTRLGAGPVALQLVTEDPAPVWCAPVGIALSAGDGEACYVPFAGVGRSVGGPEVLATWLEDEHVTKLGHDLIPAIVALRRCGIRLAGIAGDSACASHLTQPSNWAPHDLAIVAKQVLGRALPEEDTVRGVGRQRKPWAQLPIERAAELAGHHADAAAAIWQTLAPKLAPALLAEYLELSDTLVRMELTGIAVDARELDGAEQDFAVIEGELQHQIEALAGRSFNINSTKQLGSVLFEELKLPIVSHTKTGWSTSIEALEPIEHAHPIVPLVLRWRLLRRMRDSWITALRERIDEDGRVHSRFHPARSFSGRLVNTNPDLGRVPGRTPEMARIRRAFVARPGSVLVSVDYNQLGLHVLAHLTKDPALVEPIRTGEDIHALTASAVLDRPLAAITDADRQIGKVVNFATFAGQGPSALALQLGVTPQEARDLIARFDRRYAGVRAFQDDQLRLARERGYVETLAGRHWPIGGLESLDPHDRSYAERMARRATHEGSVADVARRGLRDADRALRRAGLTAVPLLQIVDEVLFEVPEAELAVAARVAATAMREAFSLDPPLRVGVEAGPSWAELQPLAVDESA